MAQVQRSDIYTSVSRKLEYYSDFDINLDIHPGKKDITRFTNEESIKRSVRNLITTNFGERLFQPAIGSNLNRTLFELADAESLDLAQDQIAGVLRLFEPRIKLIRVIANVLPDQNSMSLTIVFSIINTSTVIELGLILYRVR